MKNFKTATLENFLTLLGSESGAPGGGAAAALTGATGAALIEMVSRLNDKRFGSSSKNAKKAEAFRTKMQKLMDEDAKAFEAIQKIYKRRKKNPVFWQNALKVAAKPPFQICELCSLAATLVKKEKSRTSAWLESDRKEAAILLRAAFESAEQNVSINLREIQDLTFTEKLKRKLNQWRKSL